MWKCHGSQECCFWGCYGFANWYDVRIDSRVETIKRRSDVETFPWLTFIRSTSDFSGINTSPRFPSRLNSSSRIVGLALQPSKELLKSRPCHKIDVECDLFFLWSTWMNKNVFEWFLCVLLIVILVGLDVERRRLLIVISKTFLFLDKLTIKCNYNPAWISTHTR